MLIFYNKMINNSFITHNFFLIECSGTVWQIKSIPKSSRSQDTPTPSSEIFQ